MVIKNLESKNILVTGGAGFMGSSFIHHLLSSKDFYGTIVNYDALTYCGNLENLREVQEDRRYIFVKGNILDQKFVELILESHKIDLIVHFAAETHVDRSIESSRVFLETNILGTHSLLEALRKFSHMHFHHISTDEVYGSCDENGCFYEESAYLPNSPYSASKAASDHLVRSYIKTHGISATISHAGNNFGPRQYPEKLIPFMITQMMENKPLTLYGNGLNRRDWVFVEDHSRAIEAILRHGRKGEIYNIASEENLSNLELVLKLIEIYASFENQDPLALKEKILFIKDRPGHDFCYAMDAKKLCQETKWQPKYSLDLGLKKTIEWYLSQKTLLLKA